MIKTSLLGCILVHTDAAPHPHPRTSPSPTLRLALYANVSAVEFFHCYVVSNVACGTVWYCIGLILSGMIDAVSFIMILKFLYDIPSCLLFC